MPSVEACSPPPRQSRGGRGGTAGPDPKRALAFAVQLQERFFQHRWDGTRAIDDAYATARSGGTLGKGPHVPRSRVASDDGLRPPVAGTGLARLPHTPSPYLSFPQPQHPVPEN